ncbi:MAG TPA: VCBS repeat-containing protein [Chthonomonadaceae bacterium]|nr:VCBS repeat-containing protein [Chthonomonadaceae bacterium]
MTGLFTRSQIFFFVILGFVLLIAPPTSAQQRTIVVQGVPRLTEKHAVANFIDLAQQEQLHPPANKHILFPRPKARPGLFTARAALLGPQSQTPVSLEQVTPRFIGKSRAPGLSESFLGLLDDGTSVPPDTQGAVGPTYVMTTLNSQVGIETKTGSSVSTVSLNGFFSKVLPSGDDCFDPHCYYDPVSNRFIFSTDAAVLSNTTNNAILLAVSQSSDPTKSWDFYSIMTDTSNVTWVDFPSLGFNENWIVVSGNVFDNSTGNFNKDVIYAISKASALAGSTSLPFTVLTDTTGGFAMAPAIETDNTATEYLMDDWMGDNAQGQGQLRISTITGSVGHEVLTLGTSYPTVSAPWSDNDPGDFAPQLGSSQKINTGDSRLYEVVLNNGTLWTAHTINLPAITPTRSAVQWWQVTTGGTILQYGRLDDPTATVFRAYPSLAVNANGDVLMGYSEFSATIYASAFYTYRTPTDTPNTMESEALLKAGEASYYKTFGGAENRWGDYSNTVVDPSDGLTMWTIQEYAATPFSSGTYQGQSRWGTWWGAVPAPATAAAPGDFNGDGIPDILFQNASTGQMSVWFMNGAAAPYNGSYITPSQSAAWHVVGDADFNGDGHPDIVFYNPSTGQMALWLMNNVQATNGFLLPTPPSGWNPVAINNFGNGSSDILLQNGSTGQMAVWFFTGTSLTNGAFISPTPPAGWKVVGTGDFNTDGKPDIVLQNPGTGQLAVWFMNGTTVSGASYISPAQSAAWRCVAVLDLNKDGKPDLVFQNTSTGQIAYWIMNGVSATNGGFLPSQPSGWQVVGPR